ncbi:MAG: heat-inducible transcriptional repressor HrcA [Actinobacteria bacterium]|nr:heat-inducible transcriptional repressor HrcA [Actinomycetota bacterium]NCU96036.1 heat-inducible transcriptional repressor HrcA [Actinomycetota bacterium]
MSSKMHGRQLDILRAIVDEYVSTEEPVGSKTLAARTGLGVSPATIRNEMAVLEDAGLITQPHTSAGRIPTNKGYRVFVDQLADIKPLSSAERRAIENFLDGASDLDDVISRTVRLLAQVTKQVAVVQYPSLIKAKVRHIELVLLNNSRVMIVLITDTGRVEQRMVELPFDISDASLADLHKKLNQKIARQTLSNIAGTLEGISSAYNGHDKSNVIVIITTLIEMAIEHPEEKVVFAGTSNLARANQDLSSSMQSILEALEEQVVLLRLLSGTDSSVKVKIGDEQSEKSLKKTSLVSVGYADIGALGILGPTRMDYAASISAVNAVANYVGRFLTESK